MAFQVELRSREQILGELIRTILVNSDLTDIAPGSTLATLLEAIAASEYQISLSSLKILQSTNLESLVGTALDKKAESVRLPNSTGGIGRKPATQSSGQVTIGSSFAKISSKLYAGKPAPFAGSNKLFVENATFFEFEPDGVTPIPAPDRKLYLGRGTVDRFEGPIPYSSVVNSGSFWTINLTVNLTKSHLTSDLVVLAQGGDRSVSAGTTVQAPPNSDATAVAFKTIQSLLIPDGEAEGSATVVCSQFGEAGNVLAGGIKEFTSSPFDGATVINPTSYANGKSTESDEDLRQRLKNYASTLSRGTRGAILAAIIGASDQESGRTIQSAVVLEPVEPGDFARVYIDDGTGLEPTFGEQAYEVLLQAASGQETGFRAAQFPITPSVAEGANTGPFVIQASQSITVHVDEVVETYTITPSNYKNLNSATAYEIVRDLNAQSNVVGWRTLDGGSRVVMIDLSGKAETMSIDLGDLQTILGLPTATLRPIFVYKDSQIQSFRGHTATLATRPRNQWDTNTLSDWQDVRVSVDGVIQTLSINDSDFAEFQSTRSTATVVQWAVVLSRKIAGAKFTVSGQILVWSTYQDFSPGGTLEILETKADGTYAGWIGEDKMWKPASSGGILSDVGFAKDFKLNRFTGEITFVNKPEAGASIEIGSRSTRAYLRSVKTPTGLYLLGPLAGTVGNARLVLGFDGEFAIRAATIAPGTSVTPSQPDASGASNIIRLTSNAIEVFDNAIVGDWLYLIADASIAPILPAAAEGLYRLKALGLQKFATNQIYTGLAAVGYAMTSLTAGVLKDRSTVTVTQAAHGLQTGDLISVVTAAAIGGVSGANLSVTDAPVTVIDSNRFQYTALASATSTATDLLDDMGTNLIAVTQAAHGFESGALVTTSVSSGFAGISSGNLSVVSTPIEVLDNDTYRYRAAAAATVPLPVGGTVNSVTYLADAWVEFEVSSPQLTSWITILGVPQVLTDKQVYLFRSTVQPQLVDFGNAVSSLTIDQTVEIINNSIAAGVAFKRNPQQFEIRSSDFQTGTAAVLASIGTASPVIEANVDSSQQAHIGYSASGSSQAGFPVVKSVSQPTAAASGHGTRTYLMVDRDLTDILDEATDPAINAPSIVTVYPEGFQNLWITGRQSGLASRVYNNQTTAPFTGILRGEDAIRPVDTSDTEQTSPDTLDRYANYSLRLRDLGFNNHDKLVVEMDLNPTDKTVAIQLSKKAKIQDIDAIAGSGKGQVISFRLKDPDDSNKPFFDPTSVYKDFNFEDFKILTKGVGLYREDVSDRALILRTTEYGAPHRLRLSLRLPTEPDQADFMITHSNDFQSGVSRLNLIVTLPSQTLIPGSLVNSGNYKVSSSASATLFDWRITSGVLNTGSEYQVGNVLAISGTSPLSGAYQITAATYQSWAGSSIVTSPSSAVVTVTQPLHGYLNGDLVDIAAGSAVGGIPAADLSGTFAITYIDANTFSYVAASSAPSNTGTIATATRPAITLLGATGDTTNLLATVTVTYVGHGLQTGNIVNITTSTAIGGISSGDLSVVGASIIRLDANTFTYVASSAATSTATGIIDTIARPVSTYPSVAATTTPGSAVVSLNQIAHGWSNGDIVDISTAAAIGGIPAGNLSVVGVPIVYIDANNFSYTATAASPSSSGSLTSISGGSVTVKSPGSGGLAPSALYSAATSSIRSWDIVDKTLTDLADAINDYYPTFPVATGEAIGTGLLINPISKPTYIAYPNAIAYSGSDISGAFIHHSFNCKLSGSAGIWQYDSSNVSLNNIKATVQSDESIYPTTADAAGTTYSPIDEEVYIVPTNTKSLSSWLNFNAASSLDLLANIERIRNDDNLQISSKEDGSAGAVAITGVTANTIAASVLGNASTNENAIQVAILSADAKAIAKYSMIKVENSIASELLRPYRMAPTTVAETTSANTTEINTFFRQTNALKYIRVNSITGRLLFLRNGQGPSQTEPLSSGNTIEFVNMGSGLVKVISALAAGAVGTGKLSARVGDMMYIQPYATTAFTVDQRCKALPGADGLSPEYLGFPVVYVENDSTVYILAPSITNFATISLSGATAATDLVFMPAIWNEKNIRTNHKEGTDFDTLHNSGNAYFLIKSLGSGFMSVWMQNSATEATDDLALGSMSVSVDDWAVLGEGFDPANRGTFRIVAHNGRNHLIIHNSSGGKDELIDTNTLANGGMGDRKWRVGPLNSGAVRPLRILAGESIRLEDRLRISTPAAGSQWFNSVFFGSWKVTKIGLTGVDYTGAPLPHTTSSGVASQANICPYIEFEMPDAPITVTDSLGVPVDTFLIGANDKAIGFVEGTPYFGFRLVSGHGVNPQDPEKSDIFLEPKFQSSKMSDTFGTTITVYGKAGYAQQTFQGIDGYKIFTGPVQTAHRIIDGLPTNTVLFPGVKAAGAIIEVLPPLIRSIQLDLQVRPKDGVTLNSITELVRSTAANSINSLGVGKPVVLSEIIRVIQSLPGVFSVTILGTRPSADEDRIVVGDVEKAFVLDTTRDITVG